MESHGVSLSYNINTLNNTVDMSSAVQNIIQNSLGDGARTTKFDVIFEFTNDASPATPDNYSTLAMVKTASYPAKSHTTIDFRFKGRAIPLKGQTKYTQTWECAFYLTEDHGLKNAFEVWIEALDQRHNYINVKDAAGVRGTQILHAKNSNYTQQIKIHQRNFDDTDTMAEYTLHNAFPIEVSPIATSYESVGEVQEFTVTFSYSYFVLNVNKGGDGNFVDQFIDRITDNGESFLNEQLSTLGNKIGAFVKDAKGNSLNGINDFLGNTTSTPSTASSQITPSETRNLVSGGTGQTLMVSTISDVIA